MCVKDKIIRIKRCLKISKLENMTLNAKWKEKRDKQNTYYIINRDVQDKTQNNLEIFLCKFVTRHYFCVHLLNYNINLFMDYLTDFRAGY